MTTIAVESQIDFTGMRSLSSWLRSLGMSPRRKRSDSSALVLMALTMSTVEGNGSRATWTSWIWLPLASKKRSTRTMNPRVWHQTPKIRCHVSYWRLPKDPEIWRNTTRVWACFLYFLCVFFTSFMKYRKRFYTYFCMVFRFIKSNK